MLETKIDVEKYLNKIRPNSKFDVILVRVQSVLQNKAKVEGSVMLIFEDENGEEYSFSLPDIQTLKALLKQAMQKQLIQDTAFPKYILDFQAKIDVVHDKLYYRNMELNGKEARSSFLYFAHELNLPSKKSELFKALQGFYEVPSTPLNSREDFIAAFNDLPPEVQEQLRPVLSQLSKKIYIEKN